MKRIIYHNEYIYNNNLRVRECDWCKRDIQLKGKYADPFVINSERKIFCKVHYKGHEPDRDCMDEYLKDIKRKLNDKISRQEKQKEEEEKEKQEEKEKKIAAIPRVMAKAKTYQNHHQR